MMFRRVLGVVGRVDLVRVRQMRVVRRLMVIAGLVVLRRFRMMMRGHAVMMRRLAVLVYCLL